jgi:hypothetical protein
LSRAQLACGEIVFGRRIRRSPKKIKELLQERHVAQPQSQALAGGCDRQTKLFGCEGFRFQPDLRAEPGQEAVMIREMPWALEGSAI